MMELTDKELRKNYYILKNEMYDMIGDNKKIEHGQVCGITIKPYKTGTSKLKNEKIKFDATSWGLFLYIKLDNGKQMDLVYDMKCNTYLNPAGSLFNPYPFEVIKKRKHRVYKYPLLPRIFNILGVSDWVNVVGTDIEISFIEDYNFNTMELFYRVSLSCTNGYITPNYFKIS